MKSLKLIIILILMTTSGIMAQETKWGKMSGLMFGDYYMIASNHDSSIVGSNGFWFRRIYLTYENDIADNISVRVRLEMGSAGNFSTTPALLVPFIKDAYLKWKINEHHELLLGISEPPTLRILEKYWGHRFLEKTPLDLQRWAPSRDFGLTIRGDLLSSGILKYNIMLADGNGNKSETNKGKKLMGSLSYHPTEKLTFEIYGDWNDNTGATDWITLQALATYKTENLTLGIQYAHQARKIVDTDDLDLNLISGFAIPKITEKIDLVLRIDRMFEPNPNGDRINYIPFDNTSAATLYILGMDIKPVKSLTLTPNVEFVKYDENDLGITPSSDIIPRLTFYYKF